MRRKLAAAVLAAGMLAAAGCSDGNGGGRSTAEVCNDINQTVDPLIAEFNSALLAAGAAAAQGDEEALAESSVELDSVVGQITSAVRQGADNAEDAELREALNDFVTGMEDLRQQVVSGSQPDLNAFGAVSARVGSFCNQPPGDDAEESGDGE